VSGLRATSELIERVEGGYGFAHEQTISDIEFLVPAQQAEILDGSSPRSGCLLRRLVAFLGPATLLTRTVAG
jgi:hypothetical protein